MTCLDIHTIPCSGRVVAASLTDGSQVNLWTVGLTLGSHGNCVLGDYQKAKLVDEIVRDDGRPALIDAIEFQREFLVGLTASGWIIERPFQRMRFGCPTRESKDLGFAVAGPEYG